MKSKKKLVIPGLFLALVLVGGGGILFLTKNRPLKQIILISIDTLRSDHVTPYGYRRDTSPALNELSQQATLYENVYVNGCWTMPSHMSMLTGTLPSRHGINMDWNTFRHKKEYPQLNGKVSLVSELLEKKGFFTIKIGRLPKALGFSRGFSSNQQLDPFYNREHFEEAVSRLRENKDRNFFMFIHTWMVHAPYANSFYLSPEVKSRLGQETLDEIDSFRQANRGGTGGFGEFMRKNGLWNCRSCVDLYDSGIHYVDQRLARLIAVCRELGIFDDVMFIVTSDHGEHFGERTESRCYDSHGWDFYEELIKVPMIIKYPRQKDPVRKSPLVSMVGLVPSILDYYGIAIPDFIQGVSFLDDHTADYAVSEAVTHGDRRELKMIRMGEFKLILDMRDIRFPGRMNWNGITDRRLFNLKDDPGEHTNLIKKMIYRKIGFDYERLLIQTINNSVNFGNQGKTTKIRKETLEFMESLGYL